MQFASGTSTSGNFKLNFQAGVVRTSFTAPLPGGKLDGIDLRGAVVDRTVVPMQNNHDMGVVLHNGQLQRLILV